MIPENEFSVVVRMDDIGAGASQYTINADETERAALALRFDLVRIDKLSADISLVKTAGGIKAAGLVTGELIQSCAATGEDVPASIHEPINILFIPEPAEDGEIELAEDECDTMFHDGRGVDIGEAAAQTMGLSLNPYPRSKGAQAALKKAGVKNEEEAKIESGPFAALAALKGKAS
jgi:uncharacterized metal-binding protein YceD (DUF177 family)